MQTAVGDVDKLARTDHDIAEVERRAAYQSAFIAALVVKGFDTGPAERLLQLMRRDLDTMRGYRRVLLGEREPPPAPARPAETSPLRPKRAARRPHPAPRGPDAPRPGAPAAAPTLVWESLPSRASIARTEGHLLVVRPIGGKRGTFRFAVLKRLPANGGLLHVTAGCECTAREAMLAAERAAERAIVPAPGPTAPGLFAPPPPESDGGRGGRGHPPPQERRVRFV